MLSSVRRQNSMIQFLKKLSSSCVSAGYPLFLAVKAVKRHFTDRRRARGGLYLKEKRKRKRMKPLWQLAVCVCLTGFFCAAADTCSAYGAWIGDGETGWAYVENGEEKRDSWHWDGSWWYYLAQDGKMETGWLLKDGIWYYLCPEVGMPQGSAASGWKWIDEKW